MFSVLLPLKLDQNLCEGDEVKNGVPQETFVDATKAAWQLDQSFPRGSTAFGVWRMVGWIGEPSGHFGNDGIDACQAAVPAVGPDEAGGMQRVCGSWSRGRGFRRESGCAGVGGIDSARLDLGEDDRLAVGVEHQEVGLAASNTGVAGECPVALISEVGLGELFTDRPERIAGVGG